MAKKQRKIDKVETRSSFPIVVYNNYNPKSTLSEWKPAKASALSVYYPIRKPLYDLYENIVEDTHAGSVLGKRTLAIQNVTWVCMHDGKVVDSTNEIIETHFFEMMLRFMIESKLYGHSLIEVDFRKKKCELIPRGHVIPQFKCVLPDPLIVTDGIPYDLPPYNTTVFECGEQDDLGLIFNIAPYVLLKKGNVGDWATFCEVFGMPLKVGEYDPNIPGNEAQLEKALSGMGSNSYVVHPSGSKVDFIQASTNGSGTSVHEGFAKFCNSEISKAIVGQTMTSEDGSSKSQSETHMQVQEDIHQADRRFIARLLNERVMPLLIAQGFDIPQGAKFQSIDEEEQLSKKDRLEMDLKIHKQVGRIPKKYFSTEYNVEFVDPSDEVEQEDPQEEDAPEDKPGPGKKKPKTKKPVTLSDIQPELVQRKFFDVVRDFFAQALR